MYINGPTTAASDLLAQLQPSIRNDCLLKCYKIYYDDSSAAAIWLLYSARDQSGRTIIIICSCDSIIIIYRRYIIIWRGNNAVVCPTMTVGGGWLGVCGNLYNERVGTRGGWLTAYTYSIANCGAIIAVSL